MTLKYPVNVKIITAYIIYTIYIEHMKGIVKQANVYNS